MNRRIQHLVWAKNCVSRAIERRQSAGYLHLARWHLREAIRFNPS